MRLIPFNKPSLLGKELDLISDSVRGGWISGDGPFTKKCEQFLKEQIQDVQRALLTTSCTHALEMCAMLLKLQPGDEVIVPSFTFVSTAQAFHVHGAQIRFADVDPNTMNIDVDSFKSKINEKTRAVVIVHYAGVACDLDAIVDICNEHAITLIEDNAHGLFGKYKGKDLGTFGSLACLSFHETKNFTCGEGGALLINDKNYIERAEIAREKGTDRSKFFRGEIDKYSWVDIGSSYVMSDILASFLYAQLLEFAKVQEKRRKIWHTYNNELQSWALAQNVQLPAVPEGCQQAFHMFYMLMPNNKTRVQFLSYLKEHDIYAVFHYLPLERSTFGKSISFETDGCPNSFSVSERLVRLPFYFGISEQDVARVILVIKAFRLSNPS